MILFLVRVMKSPMKNKKAISFIIGMLTMMTGMVLMSPHTKAAEGTPTIQEQCENSGNQTCCVDYNMAIEAATQDWEANLLTLKDQKKPASEMVDEAYENLRGYNCWLEYICRSVQFSGYAPIESGIGGLSSEHLGIAPGCQMAEEMSLEMNFSNYVTTLKNTAAGTLDPDIFYNNNRINYFASCQTDRKNDNQNPSVEQLNNNFNRCKQTIELKFGCNADDPNLEKCLQESKSVAVLEAALKNSHAEQKTRALEKKLGEIVTRLHTVEEHVTYMSNFLTQLDQRLACLAFKCT